MKTTFSPAHWLAALLATVLLLSFGFPGTRAQAAPEPTPTAPAHMESQSTCDASRTIQVSGTASVNVPPDRALVQLGVQSNGRSPKDVQQVNAATIRRVTTALQELGIAERDVATDWYVIQPLYEDYDSLHIKGYRIHNVVAITVRKVESTNDVIAAAFQAGANQVVDVEYYTSDLRKYRDQARELAMQAALEKAQALAGAAGAQTGCVMHIHENTWSYLQDSGWSWWYGGGHNELWTQNVVQNAAPAGNEGGETAEDGPVNPGQISIRAEVQATFRLK